MDLFGMIEMPTYSLNTSPNLFSHSFYMYYSNSSIIKAISSRVNYLFYQVWEPIMPLFTQHTLYLMIDFVSLN
jgi:hypothetical protein